MREERGIVLASLFALCYGVGLQGNLAQPAEWLSGSVWSLLYGLMAVAAWLVWTEREHLIEEKRFALGCFMGQLALNGLLPWALSYRSNPGVGLAVLVLLVAGVQYTGALFHRIRPSAGLLWLPYVFWTAFMLLSWW